MIRFPQGFTSHEELEGFLDAQDDLKARRRAEPGATVYGTHRLQMKEDEAFVSGQHRANLVSGVHRLRKWHQRNQARILLFAFGGSELYWCVQHRSFPLWPRETAQESLSWPTFRFILYAATIWFGKNTTFWQPKCDELVGASSWALIRGVSFTIFSLAFLFTLFLCIPVFHPTCVKYRSTADAGVDISFAGAHTVPPRTLSSCSSHTTSSTPERPSRASKVADDNLEAAAAAVLRQTTRTTNPRRGPKSTSASSCRSRCGLSGSFSSSSSSSRRGEIFS